MARAANTGISAVIDARGRIVASLALGRSGVVDAALPRALPPTPYARFGDLGFAVLLLISLVVSLAAVPLVVMTRTRISWPSVWRTGSPWYRSTTG